MRTAPELTDATRGRITAPTAAVAGQPVTVLVGTAHAGRTVDVWLFSMPRLLATQVVAADGTVRVTIPTDAPAGVHRIAVVDADGVVIGWQQIEISAAGPAGDGLASTGAAGAVAGVLAVLLTVVGAGVLVVRRRTSAKA